MSVFPSQTNFVTGDILTATAVNEIGQAINLLDGAQFAAGKNKILNGDFAINQRAFTSTTADGFIFDRFRSGTSGGTSTFTAQTFTPGAAPVSGYNGKNYVDVATTGQTLSGSFTQLSQRIEDVRTLAGQTVTVSFWAKAASGTPKVAVDFQQFFGAGGSTSVNNYAGEITTSTSWVRYSLTTTLGSLTGKTLGADSLLRLGLWTSAGSDYVARGINIGLQTATISFWGIQVEAANTASNFQTATGTLQGELAACQRYYWRNTATNANGAMVPSAFAYSATTAIGTMSCPVTMRTSPTVLETSGLNFRKFDDTIYSMSALTFDSSKTNPNIISIAGTIAGATAGWTGTVGANSNAAAYIGVGAEL